MRPYLRDPSILGSALAFVADDDIWLTSTSETLARRLTADTVPVSDPRISPDGSAIAFTSRRDGVSEAYVVELTGGDARRLTYFGDGTTRVTGWSGDGKVIVTSATGEPFRSRTWAYAVDPDRGRADRLHFGPVSAVRVGPTGSVVLGYNQARTRGASWKRYRGGRSASLLIDVAGSGEFARFMADLDGQLEDPMWVGDRVAFLSDHEGCGNVYSVTPDGTGLLRHTDHDEFYARAAQSDGTRVAYQSGGDIWLLEELGADSQPRRLDIELSTPRTGRSEWRLRARQGVGAFSPGQKGQASAVTVRGNTFWLTLRDGPARHLAGGGAVRTRMPVTFGPVGAEAIAYVTDATNEDAIEVVRAAPEPAGAPEPRRIGAGELGRILSLEGSPDGRHLAAVTHDGRVVLVDVESAELQTIDESEHGEASGLTFSPDSRWLAWSSVGRHRLRQIKLARLVTGLEVFEATPLRFDDHCPAFTPNGKYLAFLSARTFDPVYDAQVFDMSFVMAYRPYLIALAATTPSPFAPRVEGRPRPGDEDSGTGGAGHRRHQRANGAAGPGPGPGSAEPSASAPPSGQVGDQSAPPDEVKPITIDIEGIFDRVTPVPVAPGKYRKLRSVHNGLLWLRDPPWGVLGEGRPVGPSGPNPALIHFDIDKRRERPIVDAVGDYSVTGDGRSIVVKQDNKLRLQPSDERPKDDDDNVIEIDLSRIRVSVEPPVEWLQMYDEAARLMREYYWLADMGGVDWSAIVARYRTLVERIATRDDLSELLWEVQGELGNSHAYETPPTRHPTEEEAVGYLGADFAPLPDGSWQVTRILPSESSVPGARSPLAAPGVAVSVGDSIVAVDNRPVDAARGPAVALVGAADTPVLLTVRPGDGGELRQVAVVALSHERSLRYHDWVTQRRAVVHEATAGRVGYLHIPDMVGSGWAEFHRDLRLEVDREALVVDVRNNGGGHVSELVLEKLSRTVHAWDVPRYKEATTYPADAPRGPLVAVVDEHAGSDGDIAAAVFRQRALGPLVGTRTWGGVVGIDRRYNLVDGTSVTQPRYAFWLEGVGFDLENRGVEPDVEVRILPQDWAAGRDPQLEEAIRLALSALDARPAARPPDLPSGLSRAAPPLPPRGSG